MSIEASPPVRTVVSGLAAITTTALLMTAVIESLNPAALQQNRRESSELANAAVLDTRSDVSLIRRV